MSKLPISQVSVDENIILNELKRNLTQRGTWKDMLPTNVGTTILKLISGSTTVHQHYILTALREAFLGTALRDSSVYEGTRALGVHITRKIPSSTTVQLQNNLDITYFIPPYQEFVVGNEKFYNVGQYVVPAQGTISNVNLYQGEVRELTFNTDQLIQSGLPSVLLRIPNFAVSETDLLVWCEDKISGVVTQWSKSDVGLFELGPTDANFYEVTTGEGDVMLLFGTGEYGASLPPNNRLHVRCVVTKGSVVSGISGERVRLTDRSEVAGWTTSAVTPGGDEKPAVYYKRFAPLMYRAKRKAISRTEVRAHIMRYPGVADCQIFTQKDIAPNDPRWQNVMRVCILPESSDSLGGSNPNPQSAAWAAFTEWLENSIHHLGQVQPWNPTKTYVRLNVVIAVFANVDREETRILATERILRLFQRRPNILGMRLSKSDIENACRVAGVDYIEVHSPDEEVIPVDRSHYVVLDGMPSIQVVNTERR